MSFSIADTLVAKGIDIAVEIFKYALKSDSKEALVVKIVNAMNDAFETASNECLGGEWDRIAFTAYMEKRGVTVKGVIRATKPEIKEFISEYFKEAMDE